MLPSVHHGLSTFSLPIICRSKSSVYSIINIFALSYQNLQNKQSCISYFLIMAKIRNFEPRGFLVLRADGSVEKVGMICFSRYMFVWCLKSA